MNLFIPCSSQAVCEAISTHLWSLSRPPAVRTERDTSRLFECRVDVHGQWWLEVVPEYEIPVHATAELGGIADILLEARIAQAEIDQLASLITSRRGGSLRPWNYFPAVFKDAALPREQITWPEAIRADIVRHDARLTGVEHSQQTMIATQERMTGALQRIEEHLEKRK